MDDAKRSRLIIALLGLVSASERVRMAVSSLRDEQVDADVCEALGRIVALFTRGEERKDGACPEMRAALEATLTQFICDLAETMLPSAMGELERIEPLLTSPRAKAVLPLLHMLVDELKEHAYTN